MIHYLAKDVHDKSAGYKDVDILDKYSASYSIDGGVHLNENRKYCHFRFWSLE